MEHTNQCEKGLENRKKVLGAAHVDKSWASADEFNRPMQKLVTEYCWGEIWGDATLPFKTRSMLNLAMLTAMSQHHELARSEERRVGKEWVSTCRSRRAPAH